MLACQYKNSRVFLDSWYLILSAANVTSSIKVEGHLVTLKEQQHLKVHKVSMRPEVGNMKIYASNLINDNEELSK